MTYYIGLDGGGTKTECVLLNDEGQVVAQSVVGPSNPLRVGFDQAFVALRTAAECVLSSAGLGAGQVQGVGVGLAGAGRPQVLQRVGDFLARAFPAVPVRVATDLEVALEAATGEGAGVVLVAGTGSAAYGRNFAGQTARAGGHGPWIGDEGSAFDIGRRAVAAAARARDLIGPATLLAETIPAALKCETWDELIGRIAANADEVLPRLFPLVVQAADAEDAAAREILFSAAMALGRLASSVIRRLGLTSNEFLLAKSGGVFGHSALLDAALDAMLVSTAARAKFEILRVSPAVGAARLVMRLSAGSAGKTAHGGKS